MEPETLTGEDNMPQLERYECLALHQKGALTKVYKAVDKATGDTVAVKLLATSDLRYGIEDPEKAEMRFLREFRMVQRLDHPNIVRALDFGFTQDSYYLVMEFVDGGDLCDYLEQRRPLNEEHAWRVLHDMAAALHCAYLNDVLHRDIKPGNILIASNGAYKLTDFGLAVFRNDRGLLTESDLVLGTLEYASPEQLRGEEMDIRTDLYSLGVTMYELLTLTMPFVGKNPTDTMQKVCLGRKLPLTILAPNLSQELGMIIHRLMEPDPLKRFGTPRKLLEAIETFGPEPTQRGKE